MNDSRLFPMMSDEVQPTDQQTVANCIFCKIIAGELPAPVVFEDDLSLAFLDHRPVFPGHTLLVPRIHCETLADLPRDLLGPFFQNAQLLASAVEQGLVAHGTFVGINNRVSQSVPHLHVHIVPRRRKDGLRGFFWPRHKYESNEQILQIQAAIKSCCQTLRQEKTVSRQMKR
jgi:histidine triad (HIT) family protein